MIYMSCCLRIYSFKNFSHSFLSLVLSLQPRFTASSATCSTLSQDLHKAKKKDWRVLASSHSSYVSCPQQSALRIIIHNSMQIGIVRNCTDTLHDVQEYGACGKHPAPSTQRQFKVKHLDAYSIIGVFMEYILECALTYNHEPDTGENFLATKKFFHKLIYKAYVSHPLGSRCVHSLGSRVYRRWMRCPYISHQQHNTRT